jgi:hypothetical protein
MFIRYQLLKKIIHIENTVSAANSIVLLVFGSFTDTVLTADVAHEHLQPQIKFLQFHM